MPTDGAGRVGREHPAVLTRPTLLLMFHIVALSGERRDSTVVPTWPPTVAADHVLGHVTDSVRSLVTR